MVAPPANLPLQCGPLTDRSTNGTDKRRVILDAAVRVFAQKGYSGTLSVELFLPRFQKGDPYEAAVEIRRKAERVMRQANVL